jgi:hypothetical protein
MRRRDSRAHYLLTNLLGGLHHLTGDLRLARTCTYIQDAVAQFVFKYSIPDISLAICFSEFHSSMIAARPGG